MCHHQVVWIKGHGRKRIIVLKNDMKGKDDDGHLSHSSLVEVRPIIKSSHIFRQSIRSFQSGVITWRYMWELPDNICSDFMRRCLLSVLKLYNVDMCVHMCVFV